MTPKEKNQILKDIIRLKFILLFIYIAICFFGLETKIISRIYLISVVSGTIAFFSVIITNTKDK